MIKQEVITLLGLLVAAYPDKFSIKPGTIDIWTKSLADLQTKDVLPAVEKMILQSPYPPAISDIRKHVAELANPDIGISAADAWGMVMRAACNYGARRQTEGLNSLPDFIRDLVKNIGWMEICLSENQDVLRGEFFKLYHTHQQREQELMVLPERLQQALTQSLHPLKGLHARN